MVLDQQNKVPVGVYLLSKGVYTMNTSGVIRKFHQQFNTFMAELGECENEITALYSFEIPLASTVIL